MAGSRGETEVEGRKRRRIQRTFVAESDFSSPRGSGGDIWTGVSCPEQRSLPQSLGLAESGSLETCGQKPGDLKNACDSDTLVFS